MKIIPAEDFPSTLEYIQSIGQTDTDRAAELGVSHTKTVERMRKRLPSHLWPFLKSRHAIPLLQCLLNDLKQANLS